jgi:hypothetical protein
MGKQLIPSDSGDVQEITLREALEERYSPTRSLPSCIARFPMHAMV